MGPSLFEKGSPRLRGREGASSAERHRLSILCSHRVLASYLQWLPQGVKILEVDQEMAMSLATWLSTIFASVLLVFPLGALARDHSATARVCAVTRPRGALLPMQHWSSGNPQAVNRWAGRRGFSGALGRVWAADRRPSHLPNYAQGFGWPYGYSGYETYPHSASPYGYSTSFLYLYFYDLYAQEAGRSRQAADEFEASLAREGKLTGPAEVGSFASDSRPLLPRDVALTLDGQPVTPLVGGGPVVIGSGQHTLRIVAKP